MTSIDVLISCSEEFTPVMGNPGDAGYDLRSTIDISIEAGQRALIPTGVSIALPAGYVALVHPRSGLAAKYGVTVLNAPGTVDAGYRGEIAVTLINHGQDTFEVKRRDRIAQIIFQKFETVNFVSVTELPGSQRGNSGFGSTGVK
jgi:dUTP pyrophosphatase